ncbi:MAG TPA: SWIM zinc finger family protein [Ktedonobacterales bacterium]
MHFTSDQVLGLAPDAASAANGKKLASTKHWRNLGQNAEALWGECQGSALYQVRVDLSNTSVKCSCPSHKFPCKHGIGLMLLAVDEKNVPLGEPPEWVASWLAKRAASQEQKQEKAKEKAQQPTTEAQIAAQAKRMEKHAALVARGLDTLDLWLSDLMRNGIASVEQQPASYWGQQAAQLVDAQAYNIAPRVRRLAEIPGSSARWPERLLGQVGKVALLTHAYRQRETLAPALQADVRQLVDERLKKEEVTAHGDLVADDWLLLGQIVEEEDKLRAQWTWCIGPRSRRHALILQFAFRQDPFAEMLVPGTHQEATLAFFPGANPLRAQIEARVGEVAPIVGRLPGCDSIDAFLGTVAGMLARQPWQDRFLCVLCDVTIVPNAAGGRWRVRDGNGVALPLADGDYWRLLAVSGGHATDFAGEWDGERLRVLGICADDMYYPLAGVE